MSANAVLADSITAHSVDLLSVEADLQRKIVAILADLQRELVHDLTDIDPTGVTRVAFRDQRLLGLLKATRATIGKYLAKAGATSAGELGALAALESEYAALAINQALRVDIVSIGLNKDVLEALVDDTLIEGAKHSDWWARQTDDIRTRFGDAMRLGTLRGEALGDLVRRIRGRQENKYADALLAIPTKRAAMLARTAVQNIANAARLKSYEDNAGLIKGYEWLSTLDQKTSEVCRGLDSLVWDLNYQPIGHDKAFPGPTAHWGCRSTQIPILKGWDELAGPNADPALKAKLAAAPPETRASMDGQVPATMNYEAWLTGKPQALQKQILGEAQWGLWQAGKMPLAAMLTSAAQPLSVEALRAKLAATIGIETAAQAAAVAARAAAKEAARVKEIAAQGEVALIEAGGVDDPGGFKLKAAKKLAVAPAWEGMAATFKLTAIVDAAAKLKAKHAQQTKLSQYKAAILKGKTPAPSAAAVFNALSEAEQSAFLVKIDAAKAKAAAKAAAEAAKLAIPGITPAKPIDDISAWLKIGPQKGSNPGGLYTDPATGAQWYVKWLPEDRAREELLAARLYELAGIETAEVQLISYQGQTGLASRVIDALSADAAALQSGRVAGVYEGFAADAWLANWDVIGLGYDNMLIRAARAIRLDTGAALRYRAQGGLKGAAWGPEVRELDSLRDINLNPQAASVFGGISEAQLLASVRRVTRLTDDDIRAVVQAFGPADTAQNVALIDTLIARRNDLARHYPAATKLDDAPAALIEDAGAALTAQEMDLVSAARANGYSRLTDAGDIEDNHLQVWLEGPAPGKPDTLGMQLKLRADAAARLDAMIKGAASSAPIDTAALTDTFIVAIKGIASQTEIRGLDIQRVGLVRNAYGKALDDLRRAVDAARIDEAIYDAFVARYKPWMQALDKAVAPGAGAPSAWITPGTKLTAFEFPVVKAQGGLGWARIERGYAAKHSERGYLVRDAGNIEFKRASPSEISLHTYQATINGVRVRYWPTDDPAIPRALAGRVELITAGADTLAAERALKVLGDQLGVNTRRAGALDAEERYLHQLAFARRFSYPQAITDIADRAARLDAMAAALARDIGVDDIRKLPGYNPAGATPAFGHVRAFQTRPDLVTPAAKKWMREHQFFHGTGAVGANAEAVFKQIFAEGGHMYPKADWFRRGKDFSSAGMSPVPDMQRGGGAYLYTRPVGSGRDNIGFYWQGSAAARVDLRVHSGDAMGHINDGYRTVVTDAGKLSAYDGAYEAMFKDGLSLFDHGFVLAVADRAQADEVIAWLKQQGDPYNRGLWPDGRKLEAVILPQGA